MADDRSVPSPDAPADDADPTATDVEEAPAAADTDALREEVERLREENASLQDKLLRQAAEYDNYRRRSASDREGALRQGSQSVLLPVLEVYDDLKRSLEAAREAADTDAGAPSAEALAEGVDLVVKKFSDTLGKLGVEPIEAVGAPFSEEEHEALMQQPAPEGTEAGTVLAEIQPGYRLGDRVLRHARVIVAQ